MKKFLILLFSCSLLFAQTSVNLGRQNHNVDFSNDPVTKPVSVGATLPAHCTIGQLFFNTTSPAGQNFYGCTATDVWTLESVGTGGGGVVTVNTTITVVPSSLIYTSTVDGVPSPLQNVVITNTTNVALSITSVGFSGINPGDFSQTNTCVGSTIALNGTCTITIVFTPTIVGIETAMLSINGNTGNTPQTIALTGTGAAIVNSPNGPVLTPSIISTPVNTPLNITADRNVTWALTSGSAGTLSNVTATTVTYNPPTTATALYTQGGCSVTPLDSVFSTRVDNLPVDSRSSAWSTVTSAWVSISPNFDMNITDNTLGTTPMSFAYTYTQNGNYQIVPPPNRIREMGSLTTDGNTDHHLISINHQTCNFVETYQDNQANSPTNAQSGLRYNAMNYATPNNNPNGGGSTDAAGLPLEPLVAHLYELKAGVINHALRFTLCGGCISHQTLAWPASEAGGFGTDSNVMPPYGTRYRLKSSVNITGINSLNLTSNGSGYTGVPTVTFSGCTTAPTATAVISGAQVQGITLNTAGSSCTNPIVSLSGGGGTGAAATANTWSTYARVWLTALQQYGMLLADAGGSGSISADEDVYGDAGVFSSIQEINNTHITWSSGFEAVDESSLMVSATSYQANPSNSYEAINTHAILTATDGSSNSVITPIAIQPVTVGSQSQYLTFFAGAPAYQLTSWVNGSSNQNVIWSLASGPGTLTSGGIYTAPSSVSVPTPIQLLATSVADTAAKFTIYGMVAPVDGAGALRVDVGNNNTYTDAAGNLWQSDQFFWQSGFSVRYNDNYPGNAWGAIVDPVLYQTGQYNYGDDYNYGPFIVPNGNYILTYYTGVQGCSGTFSVGGGNLIQGSVALETQGSTENYMNIVAASNSICRIPVKVSFPATVTNNQLYFAIRATGGNNAHTEPGIAAYSIIPDTSTPHITIDNQYTSNVASGKTAQMYALGWGMSNSVQWTVSGGGTITAGGLYTAPATGNGSVSITATSIPDPTKTANTTFNYNGGPSSSSPNVSCSNSSSDATAIQSSINSNPNTTISGTCNVGATTININKSSVINGTATINSTGSYIFNVNADNVTITGLTLAGAGATVTEDTNGLRSHLIITNNTFQEIHNAFDAIDFTGISKFWTISGNTFKNIGPGTWGPSTVLSDTGIPGCVAGGTCDKIGSGIVIGGGLDNTIINNNIFSYIASDGMHLGWNYLSASTGGFYFLAQNDSVSYNQFDHIHRKAIFEQSVWNSLHCGPGGTYGCTSSILLSDTVYKGNWIHDPMFAYASTDCITVQDNSHGNIINNSCIINNGSAPASGAYGIAQSTGQYGGTRLTQGNIYDGIVGSGNWNPYIGYGYTLSGVTLQVQNDILCGDGAGSSGTLYAALSNWAGTFTQSNNWTNATCLNNASINGSSITPVFISPPTSFSSGGMGTWNITVISNLSINNVSFFLDGSTTPIITQELSDISSSFATDKKFKYHATFDTTSLATGSHTIVATAKDVSGATQSQSSTFTVGAIVPTVACVTNSGDSTAVQSAVNASGTIIISGTCSFGTTTVTVGTNVIIQGAGSNGNGTGHGATSNTVINYTGTGSIFTITGNSVTITGLTLNGGSVKFGNNNQYTGFTFTNNTIQNITGAATGGTSFGLFGPGLKNGLIDANTFQNLWPGGWPTTPNYSSGNGCTWTGADCWGPGGLTFTSLDNVSITNNFFDKISMDAIYIDWESTTGNTGGYTTTNDVIAYNTISHNRRNPIEMQSQPSGNCPGGCNFGLTNTTNLQVKGNYIHSYSFHFGDNYGSSLVPNGNVNGFFGNNTYVALDDPATPGTNSRLADCEETAGNNLIVQGNACLSPTGTAKVYPGGYPIGTSTQVTIQNTLSCGIAQFSYTEGPAPHGLTSQYNYYTTGTCPQGNTLDVSSITAAFISANNQSFPSGGNGTWNFGVISNFSIKWVKFYLDGSSTPIVTQEIQDVSTTFASDRKWLYHATLNTSTLTVGSHTIVAIATDVSGATSSQTQNFTVGI